MRCDNAVYNTLTCRSLFGDKTFANSNNVLRITDLPEITSIKYNIEDGRITGYYKTNGKIKKIIQRQRRKKSE